MSSLVRELTEEERIAYDNMIDGAKQLTLFGTEEELDPRDYIIDRGNDESPRWDF